jgi:hypothetical protein
MGIFDIVNTLQKMSEQKERAEKMSYDELCNAYNSTKDGYERTVYREEARERIERAQEFLKNRK